MTINGHDPSDQLNSSEVNAAVSAVARVPEVRAALFPLQQGYAAMANLVMEGRDIGSTIFPSTPYKYYVDASPEVRAQRRAAQGFADSVAARDMQDSTREVAPLRLAGAPSAGGAPQCRDRPDAECDARLRLCRLWRRSDLAVMGH